MSKDWPKVRLGDVLRRSEETIVPSPATEYREITVRLWGNGVVERGRVNGATLSGRRFLARAGQFITSRIDARNGAMGVVPHELDGALVTNDFPLFELDEQTLLPGFLGWLCRTRDFVDLCRQASEGTTNRVRLKEERFLALQIPLPPLAEQQRIVALIEELAAKITEVRTLRREAAEEAQPLLSAEERKLWPDSSLVSAPPLKELTSFLARGRQSEQGESDHYLIKSQHVQQNHYIDTLLRLSSSAAAKVKPDSIVRDGDILIACSAAGCLGRVARYCGDGRVASTDTHVAIARPNLSAVDADYLFAYLRGAQGQHQLRSRERGGWEREKIGFRLTELNMNDLRNVPVPVPPPPRATPHCSLSP